MFLKTVAAFVFATVTTLLLLFVMISAISNPQPAAQSGIKGKVLDFVRVIEEPPVVIKTPTPVKPPNVPEPPKSTPKIDPFDGDHDWRIDVEEPDIGDPDLMLARLDGDYLPIIRVDPEYPPRAISRGTEGYVLMEFTVTPTGRVVNPVVLSAEPVGVFERAAEAAVLKFRYKPRVVNGAPQTVPGVRTVFSFEMQGKG